jgi:hypothetical protein
MELVRQAQEEAVGLRRAQTGEAGGHSGNAAGLRLSP